MARTPRQLRREIDESRADLREALRDLEQQARQLIDPRHVIASHPVVFLMINFAAGLWLGTRPWMTPHRT